MYSVGYMGAAFRGMALQDGYTYTGRLAASWDSLLVSNKQDMNLDDSEISTLSALMDDCLKEFLDVEELLKDIESAADASNIHDAVVDIYWKLDHIKNHIIASDKGFDELMPCARVQGMNNLVRQVRWP